jgi:hypothetical protein
MRVAFRARTGVCACVRSACPCVRMWVRVCVPMRVRLCGTSACARRSRWHCRTLRFAGAFRALPAKRRRVHAGMRSASATAAQRPDEADGPRRAALVGPRGMAWHRADMPAVALQSRAVHAAQIVGARGRGDVRRRTLSTTNAHAVLSASARVRACVRVSRARAPCTLHSLQIVRGVCGTGRACHSSSRSCADDAHMEPLAS